MKTGVNQASDRARDDIAVTEPTTPPRDHMQSDEELPEQLPRYPGESPPNTLPPGVFTDHETSDETSSLISHASSLPGEILVQSSVDIRRSHRVDLRGVQLLPLRRFWQLFVLMGVLSGIGLMTINNVGNVVKALWRKYDDSADQTFIVRTQQLHVSILSLCSFSGRLLSGVGSDFLVKVLDANRLWCIAIASTIFFLAQLCAILITNPHLLAFVSGLSGLGYGFLFGVFPSIVAETFGIHGLSQNWGFMTLAPAITGNAFNIFYGKIYDTHSTVGPGGQRICLEGVECYKSAYVTSLVASVVGLGLALWIIQSDRKATLLGEG
ncbi:unnamed protein product [Parascedosporium putredinis]|uniref:Uncharacterized protein n=1 Tax=Parascedosporium putredinis TaxID=1442378 RepID=A0A9P1MGB8_9PEZI|nr:unnamed protein product [Parascedosporium putredinis]CAI8005118.1 unnamed protein product [Parascedosporium putredinis]